MRRAEAGPSRAKRQSSRRGRGPCQSHRPAGGRRAASLGKGLGAGGLGSGRGRASDHLPWWMPSWSANGGSERGSHLPKVTQQGDVGGLAFQAYSSASRTAKPSTAEAGGTHQAGVRTPKDTAACRGDWRLVLQIPREPAPVHTASAEIRQPLSSQAVQAQSQSRQGLEWSQELNNPGDAGLETSPGFWAGSLLFIAARGWRRVLQVPPVTGVFGGDELAPEIRGGLAGLPGAWEGPSGQFRPPRGQSLRPQLGSAPPSPEPPSRSGALRPGY